jgi:hypothetical protein
VTGGRSAAARATGRGADASTRDAAWRPSSPAISTSTPPSTSTDDSPAHTIQRRDRGAARTSGWLSRPRHDGARSPPHDGSRSGVSRTTSGSWTTSCAALCAPTTVPGSVTASSGGGATTGVGAVTSRGAMPVPLGGGACPEIVARGATCTCGPVVRAWGPVIRAGGGGATAGLVDGLRGGSAIGSAG